jgi:hypothetical protein
MALSASSGHPISCGTIASAPSWTFDKGPAADFYLTTTAVPRVLTSGGTSTVTVQDATYTRSTSASAITDYRILVHRVQDGADFPVTITSGSTGVIGSPSGDLATAVAAGTARFTGTASGKITSTTDVTVAVSGSQFDAFAAFTAGTAGKAVVDAIDNRTGSGTKYLFTSMDHSAGTYVRNSGCWAAAIDSTCVSPWNNYGVDGMAGTLVSPRHVLFANHYKPPASTVIRFVDSSNVVASRTITAISQVGSSDIAIGLLNTAVPSGVNFAKVLPSNWAVRLPAWDNGKTTLPVFTTRYGKPALVSEMVTPTVGFDLVKPTLSGRVQWWETIVTGDSGNPVFLVFGTTPVLIGTYTYGGNGEGDAVHQNVTAINATMASLGGGYSLTAIDLSAYPSY